MTETIFKAPIISLNRVTIPIEIRDDLKLKEGDIVELEIKRIAHKPPVELHPVIEEAVAE